jgi:hypothetical protein
MFFFIKEPFSLYVVLKEGKPRFAEFNNTLPTGSLVEFLPQSKFYEEVAYKRCSE